MVDNGESGDGLRSAASDGEQIRAKLEPVDQTLQRVLSRYRREHRGHVVLIAKYSHASERSRAWHIDPNERIAAADHIRTAGQNRNEETVSG